MSRDTQQRKEITRRRFLHGLALVGGSAAMAACATTPPVAVPAAPAAEQPTAAAPAAAVEPTAAAVQEAAPAAAAGKYKEAPALAELVKAGKLPPVEQRLPPEPLVVKGLEGIGKYGGSLRGAHTNPDAFEGWLAIGSEGLATIGPDNQSFVPNLATKWEIDSASGTCTAYLRKGVRWSDGEPFTADDIVFWWEDLQMNADVNPAGITADSPIQGVEKVDDYTVKIKFTSSELTLLTQMGLGQMADWAKHWHQQFHIKYADPAKLEAAVKQRGVAKWSDLINAMNTAAILWGKGPVGAPVKLPYVLKSNDMANVTSERNPYYWKVDPEGNQLPYLDGTFHGLVKDYEALKLKIVAGEIDWEALHTVLEDYPLFQQNEETGNYRTFLWNSNFAGNVGLMFNENSKDPVKGPLFRNIKFRQAMSLGLNRAEFNETLYMGRGIVQQAVSLPGTSYYDEKDAALYTQYDPDTANKMLDELGLDKMGSDGFRLGPDGKPLVIVYEYWDGHGMGKASELVSDMWRTDVHVNVQTKAVERTLQWEHMQASAHDMSTWIIARNTEVGFSPYYSVPGIGESFWGMAWGQWFTSAGKEGEEPPAEIKAQWDLWQKFRKASLKDAADLGKQINHAGATNLYTIGTVGAAPMPVITSKKLMNIPEQVPGVYAPDTNFVICTQVGTWSTRQA